MLISIPHAGLSRIRLVCRLCLHGGTNTIDARAAPHVLRHILNAILESRYFHGPDTTGESSLPPKSLLVDGDPLADVSITAINASSFEIRRFASSGSLILILLAASAPASP